MASRLYGPKPEGRNAFSYALNWLSRTFGKQNRNGDWRSPIAPDFHFNCWWLLWAGAITLGGNVYVRRSYISGRLIRHECAHAWQQHEDGWKFYPRYVWQWVKAGFSYTNIEYEREARAYEGVNADV